MIYEQRYTDTQRQTHIYTHNTQHLTLEHLHFPGPIVEDLPVGSWHSFDGWQRALQGPHHKPLGRTWWAWFQLWLYVYSHVFL
jgi:hypothetical protein